MPLYLTEAQNPPGVALPATAGLAVSSMYAAAFAGQYAVVADAATPANMPAVGIFTTSVISGAPTGVQAQGRVSNAAYSGAFTSGAPVFVASGGFPTATAPTVSGSTVQRLGVADTPTSLVLAPDQFYFRIAQ